MRGEGLGVRCQGATARLENAPSPSYARQTISEEANEMPRGGYRPGSGAPKGNANAMTNGNHSKRLKRLMGAFKSHPNVREILRIGYITGVIVPGQRLNVPLFVEVMYPAVFDKSHPLFNQINQRPEAGYPGPPPWPRFTEDELREI